MGDGHRGIGTSDARQQRRVERISQAAIEVRVPDATAAFADLRTLLLQWLERKAGAALPDNIRRGDTGELNTIGVQRVETAALDDPRYWTARQDDQDANLPRRTWITEAALAPRGGTQLLIGHRLHHVYPRNHLKKQGLQRGRYNQIANFVLAQSEINIAIGDKPPEVYFAELVAQCQGGPKKFGGITEAAEMRTNLRMSCLPETMLDGKIPYLRRFSASAARADGPEDQDVFCGAVRWEISRDTQHIGKHASGGWSNSLRTGTRNEESTISARWMSDRSPGPKSCCRYHTRLALHPAAKRT